MKNFFSKIKNGISKVFTNIKNIFSKLKNKLKNMFTKTKNKSNEEFVNFKTNEKTTGFEKDIKNVSKQMENKKSVPINKDIRFETTESNAFVASTIVDTSEEKDNIELKRNLNQDNLSYQKEIESAINNKNTEKKEEYEKIISIEIKENIGVVDFETITGKKYQKNIEDILDEKRNLYKNWDINKKCNDFAKNKIQAIRLRRNLNPIVISALNNEEDIDNYIKCVSNTERIWFNLEHDLINSRLKGKNARLMKRVGKYEGKIGAKVKKKERLIERMLKKIRTIGNEPEKMIDEIETIEQDNNDFNKFEEEIKSDINDGVTYREPILGRDSENAKQPKTQPEATESITENTEFNKRYNDYNILIKGMFGVPAKRNIKDIRNDVIHNDIYNMTSEDEVTKGIATFRVGHKLATLPTKKKEAERLLKTAISILDKDDIISKDDTLIATLEDAHLDLGNLYLAKNDFANAEKCFVDYMETVRKEKIEKYDPKILAAKKNGKVINEIDLWMEVKSKFTTGKKSMIKLLSKSGKPEEAEALYKKLLEDCKISLSDEEYQLSVDSNCIENGRYMRIMSGKTYSEPILGNEYLLLRRKNISKKAIEGIEK